MQWAKATTPIISEGYKKTLLQHISLGQATGYLIVLLSSWKCLTWMPELAELGLSTEVAEKQWKQKKYRNHFVKSKAERRAYIWQHTSRVTSALIRLLGCTLTQKTKVSGVAMGQRRSGGLIFCRAVKRWKNMKLPATLFSFFSTWDFYKFTKESWD